MEHRLFQFIYCVYSPMDNKVKPQRKRSKVDNDSNQRNMTSFFTPVTSEFSVYALH